jgi:hypothetical protein
MNNPKPLTLYPHEISRLRTGAPTLIVRPVKKDVRRIFWNQIVVNGYGGWTDEHGRPCPSPFATGQPYWVRETWGAWPDWYGGIQRDSLRYKATDNKPDDPHNAWVWRSPVTMPQRYSRLSIIVDDVAVKKVRDMTNEEAVMAGATYMPSAELREQRLTIPQIVFAGAFDSHFPDHPYSTNPYCWLATVRQANG